MIRLVPLTILFACASTVIDVGETPDDPRKRGETVDDTAAPDDTDADADADSDTTRPDDTGEGDSAVDTDTDADTGPIDADGDGYPADMDCNDTDPAAFPGAVEVCDELDNDCDGEADEGAIDADVWTVDADGDGHGGTSVVACTEPAGATDASDDCYDGSADARPGQTRYFGTDRGDGSYDYDCDGAEEPEDNRIYSCNYGGSTGTWSWTPGWVTAVPACGSVGQYVGSTGSSGMCPSVADWTASCR